VPDESVFAAVALLELVEARARATAQPDEFTEVHEQEEVERDEAEISLIYEA
jgi:hypothetical protein